MYENECTLGGATSNLLVGSQKHRNLDVATVQLRANLQPGGCVGRPQRERCDRSRFQILPAAVIKVAGDPRGTAIAFFRILREKLEHQI